MSVICSGTGKALALIDSVELGQLPEDVHGYDIPRKRFDGLVKKLIA